MTPLTCLLIGGLDTWDFPTSPYVTKPCPFHHDSPGRFGRHTFHVPPAGLDAQYSRPRCSLLIRAWRHSPGGGGLAYESAYARSIGNREPRKSKVQNPLPLGHGKHHQMWFTNATSNPGTSDRLARTSISLGLLYSTSPLSVSNAYLL